MGWLFHRLSQYTRHNDGRCSMLRKHLPVKVTNFSSWFFQENCQMVHKRAIHLQITHQIGKQHFSICDSVWSAPLLLSFECTACFCIFGVYQKGLRFSIWYYCTLFIENCLSFFCKSNTVHWYNFINIIDYIILRQVSCWKID